MRALLLVLLAVGSLVGADAVNYFRKPFLASIPKITETLRSIVLNEDPKPYSSDWVDLSNQTEGSGQMSLMDFKKKTAGYLNRMARHHAAVETKNELKERVRELKANIVLLDGVDRDDIHKFSKYRGTAKETGDILVETLSMKAEENGTRANLLRSVSTNISQAIEEMKSDGVITRYLKHNKYSDYNFLALYKEFKRDIMLETVARIYENALRGDNETDHTALYLTFLNTMKDINAQREKDCFSFDNFYDDLEKTQLAQTLVVPSSHLLFNFNENTEGFERKYHYVCIKVDKLQAVTAVGNGRATMSSRINDGYYYVLRNEISNTKFIKGTGTVGKKFRDAVKNLFGSTEDFDNYNSSEAVARATSDSSNQWGLFAVAAVLMPKDVKDTVYFEEGVFRVDLEVPVSNQKDHTHNRHQTDTEERKLKIIGYFLDRAN